VTAYCDGSGKGWVCTVLDYREAKGEDFLRVYFNEVDDNIFFEYRAMLHAMEVMEPGYEYILYNDSSGAVDHVSGSTPPSNNIITHLVQQMVEITLKKNLSVEVRHVDRDSNNAGVLLDILLYGHTYGADPTQPPSSKLEERRAKKNYQPEWDGKGLRPEVKEWLKGPEKEYEDRGSSSNIRHGVSAWFNKAWDKEEDEEES